MWGVAVLSEQYFPEHQTTIDEPFPPCVPFICLKILEIFSQFFKLKYLTKLDTRDQAERALAFSEQILWIKHYAGNTVSLFLIF